jgi:Holliday junction resolvasome RuvABC ATP-dependent DNA helicase subunit
MKILAPQKPNSSLIFTGRKDVLDKLRKIFVHHTNSGVRSRHSCLLWGMGGIGKTQICLKFTEEMSDR